MRANGSGWAGEAGAAGISGFTCIACGVSGAGKAGGNTGGFGGDSGKHTSQPVSATISSECHDIVPSAGMIPDGPLVPQYRLPAIVTES
eukprot:4928841-Prymnesium_polylepis.1